MGVEAFGRLKTLNEDQLTAVKNQLAKRTPEFEVARLIQQQWGLFQDVKEETLTQQLRRWNKKFQITPPDPNEMVPARNLAPLYERLAITSHLVEIAVKSRERVFELMAQERTIGKDGKIKHNPSLRAEIESYVTLLEKVQKQQYDTGVDVYQGPAVAAGQRGTFRSGTQQVTLPDGTVIVSQVVDATSEAISILDQHMPEQPLPPVTVEAHVVPDA